MSTRQFESLPIATHIEDEDVIMCPAFWPRFIEPEYEDVWLRLERKRTNWTMRILAKDYARLVKVKKDGGLMKYSVEWCDIKQDRLGARLLFTRKPDKHIEFMGTSMMCSGYTGLSELLDDLAVIHSIDHKEDREDV